MNNPVEFDIGPLTWVKGEIDQALHRAGEALKQQADATRFKTARNHLHQARGALTIVGLGGVSRLAELLETFLVQLEEGKLPYSSEADEVCQRALATMTAYLDELLGGMPDQSLRLWSVYSALSGLTGAAASPADLFFPDPGLRPPRREKETTPLAPAALAARLKAARLGFQRGLLKWLKADAKGLTEMRNSMAVIEFTQQQPAERAFWWSALAFLDALIGGGVPVDPAVKKLCGRIDAQIARLLEGSTQVAERLHRDVLYYVAISRTQTDHLACVRAAYRLDELMPAPEHTIVVVATPQAAQLRSLRETLESAKEDWNRYTSQVPSALPQFQSQSRLMAEQGQAIGQMDLARLTGGIQSIANMLVNRSQEEAGDSLALEVATALLLVENALDRFTQLGVDFAHQVDLMMGRLNLLLKGEPLEAMDLPQLDEISRKAQERLLMNQVVREILGNLANVEQKLDNFFRDPAAHAEALSTLQAPLKQTEGALVILGEPRAVEVLRECEQKIADFSARGADSDPAGFDELANKLSALGFFVEQLRHGPADLDSLLKPRLQAAATPEPQAIPGQPEQPEPAFALATSPAPEALATEVAASSKAEISATEPEPEPEPRLEPALPQDDAPAILHAQDVEGGESHEALVAEHIAAHIAELAPAGHELHDAPDIPATPLTVQPPSAEAARLAEASSETIDAELLEIFLEEAHEVLATIGEHLPLLIQQPNNHDLQTVIRRAFHTLKGSGRMVNLMDLGEAAWSVEQVMNQWLKLNQPLTEDLQTVLQSAHQLFNDWVSRLASRTPPPLPTDPAVQALQSACAQLLRGEALVPSAADEQAASHLADAKEEAAATVEDVDVPALEAVVEATGAAEIAETACEFPIQPETTMPDEESIQTEAASMGTVDSQPASSVPSAEASWEASLPTPESEAFLSIPESGGAQAAGELVEPEIMAGPDVAEVSLVEPLPSESMPLSASASPAASDDVVIGDLCLSPLVFDIYLTESNEHLAVLDAQLSTLREATPSREFLRAIHTLAGVSGTVGMRSVNRLGKALEHALERFAQSDAALDEVSFDRVSQTVLTLRAMVEAITRRCVPEMDESLFAELESLAPVGSQETGPQPQPEVGSPSSCDEVASCEAETAAATPEADVPFVDQRRKLRIHDDIDRQLLPIFLEEGGDLLREIGAELRLWRATPEDAAIGQHLQRLLHTLKGSARMAGAMRMGELVHGIETRIVQATRHGAAPVPAFLDDLDGFFDRALSMLDDLVRIDRGETVAETSFAEEPAAPVATLAPADEAKMREAAAALQDKDGASPSVPAGVAAVAVAAVPEQQEAVSTRAQLRVRAELIDALINEAGEMAIARGRVEAEVRFLKGSLLDLTENVIRLRQQLREIEIQAETQMQSQMSQLQEVHQDFDPLEMDRFTRFQELTRMMAESVNDVTTLQHNLLRNVDNASAALTAQSRLNRDLSQALMGVRMVPFSSVADRLYRVVRQTAKELDKRVNLDIVGGQVELDRSVLEKMIGPIEHLLRNSVAHGIESRVDRRAAGKPEIGEITVTLVQQGNEVFIEIADNGAGFNYDRIRAKAIEQGLLASGEQADERRLMQFVFLPGFSTAKQVSEIAGRGVGMDVVKTEAVSLGGHVEAQSQTGQGTRFRIFLPLTLAVTQAVLVRSGNHTFALPSSMVEQVMELRPEAVEKIRTAGGTDWLDVRYPWFYLAHLLDETTEPPPPARRHWVLLLKGADRRIALEVDGLVGNQEVVVKNIGPQLARVPGIAGATVLNDGEIALILSPLVLASHAVQAAVAVPDVAAAAPAQPVASPQAVTTPIIMVVDDSLTVRKITGRLLAREGYQVVTAKDGVDALEQLLELVPTAMLVDIEMPRMDGFELTRNVRSDPRLKDVPIVMITSRIADKHRNYAQELGVTEYLGKPYDEEVLLGLLRGFSLKAQGG